MARNVHHKQNSRLSELILLTTIHFVNLYETLRALLDSPPPSLAEADVGALKGKQLEYTHSYSDMVHLVVVKKERAVATG